MNLLDLFVKVGLKDEASKGVESLSGKLTGKLGKAAKAAAGAVAAAFTVDKIIDFGRATLESYANYEQLVGGVNKLFGDASEQLQEYAQQAYRTSGMSANQYMEQATSFSASLIQSLGGDTQKAAEQADIAMRAMSDNVNTFGSDMGSVQYAFQGFAKQNYTMLDNLKLGYGGTRSEMERLIADAEEYASKMSSMSFEEFSAAMKDTGLSAAELREQYDRLVNSTDLSIDSFSDVVTAIELIQEKQNIAGTTQKEAMKTIEGSLNMTKAAWANFLTELGKDDADIGKRLDELIESGLAVIDNVAPRIVTIADHIIDALPQIYEKVAPQVGKLIDKFSDFMGEHETEISEAANALFTVFVDTLGNVMLLSLQNFGNGMARLIETFPQWAPLLLQAAVMLFVNILQGLINATVSILNGMADLIGQLLSMVAKAAKPMFESAKNMVKSIVEAILQTAQAIWDAITSTVNGAGQIIDAAINSIRSAFDSFFAALESLWNGVRSTIGSVAQNISSAFNSIKEGASQALTKLGNFVSDAVNKVKELPSRIKNAIGDLGRLLFGAGEDVMKGFMEGIGSKFKALGDLLHKVTAMVPKNKGPEVVDKKLLTPNGEMIMQGLMDGIDNYVPRLEKQLGGITGIIGGASFATNGKVVAGSGPSVYIDGAVFNSDDRINELFGLMMQEMERKGMMNANNAAQIDSRFANGYY